MHKIVALLPGKGLIRIFLSPVVSTCLALVLATNAQAASFSFFQGPETGGYSGGLTAHNDWLSATGEPAPDYYENFEGNDWYHGQVFDSQTTSITFGDDTQFSNVGPDSSSRARTSNGGSCDLGCASPIGTLSWRGNQGNDSTINFGADLTDYLGFWIFDIDHGASVTYTIQFADGSQESVAGAGTGNLKYRFVGFVNEHASSHFEKFWVDAPSHSRFGIDELEWGSTTPVPLPGAIFFFSSGLIGLGLAGLGFRKKNQT